MNVGTNNMAQRGKSARVRFFEKIRKDDGCWIWTASAKSGIGFFTMNRRTRTASKTSWMLEFGDVPSGKSVINACGRRLCVNPHHLSLWPDQEASKKVFISRIRVTPGCWIWTGRTDKCGYGKSSLFGEDLAHRASWIMYNGEIPDGLYILHKCDVPACVNPDHLYVGTQTDNMRDMVSRGRVKIKKECVNGHSLDDCYTVNRGDGSTYRRCKKCSKERGKNERKHI